MSAYRLVQRFEDRASFPVKLNDVRDAVVAIGGVDDITFKAVDIEDNVLRGICHRWRPLARPYAEAQDCIEILYAQSLEEEWRRLVVTKELVHVLDKDAHLTQSVEQFDELVRRMARPPELRDPMNWHETSDRVGLFQALGILFPWAARQQIKPKYDAGLISDEMIAHRAVIPTHFVSYLMSADWDADYQRFMQLCEVGAAVAA
ncbi:MAG: hypothetical protein ACREEY_09055 [Brevundimonas sp.]